MNTNTQQSTKQIQTEDNTGNTKQYQFKITIITYRLSPIVEMLNLRL